MGTVFKKKKIKKKNHHNITECFPILVLKTAFRKHFSCDGQFDFTGEKKSGNACI